MNGNCWRGLTWAVLVIAPINLWAQAPVLEPFLPQDGKPVMRAEPVTRPLPPEPTPTPVQTAIPVATPIPVQRAIPVERPKPTPTPTPKPVEPQPPVPPVAPAAPAATPPPAATPRPSSTPSTPSKPADGSPTESGSTIPDPVGEIRISPQGTLRQDQVQMGFADRFYLAKSYDQAAQEYERYLTLYPAGPDRAAALYRLGESYRAIGVVNGAKNAFETLINQFPDGELAAVGSFLLAELYYSDKNFQAALPLYRKASARLKDPKLVNSAKYFTARCLQSQGQKLEARMAYEDLVGQPKDNPFYDAGRLSLALLLKEGTRTAEALRYVQAIAKETTNPDLKVQALVYSGLWQIELEQSAKAEQDLKGALQLPNIGTWRDMAELGLRQLYFRDKKYDEVIKGFTDADPKSFSGDTYPQLLSLAAQANRMKGSYAEALTLFERLIKEFPNSAATPDARYERLVCLYSQNAATLAKEIDAFLASETESPKRDQVLLMKAECLFKKPDFAAAAPIYAQVSESRQLAGTLKAEALSKLGWCNMQTKQFAKAINAYTDLIEGYPTAKSVPNALCQRGLARLRTGDQTGAVKDFSDLIIRYPKAKERELALQQKALTQGQLNENAGMATTFKLLLKEYPETPAAAEANYWIGWVAFENKDYKSAIVPLAAARKLDKQEYSERASLRIMLCHFYLEDKAALAREIELYSNSGAKGPVPYEVLAWLGQSYFEMSTAAGTTAENRLQYGRNAVKYLGMVSTRDEVKPIDLLNLGRCLLSLGDFPKSIKALGKYLAVAKDPIPRVTGLLALGQAQLSLKAFDDAQKAVDEALGLQPDGELNAKARVLAGDILRARGSLADAVKVYESVAVVFDYDTICPQSLEKAVELYKQMGKEADARRALNTLQSRYPEYFQRKPAH